MYREDIRKIDKFKNDLVVGLIKESYLVTKIKIEEIRNNRLEIIITVRKEGYELYQEYSIDLDFIGITSVTAAIIEDINDRFKYKYYKKKIEYK